MSQDDVLKANWARFSTLAESAGLYVHAWSEIEHWVNEGPDRDLDPEAQRAQVADLQGGLRAALLTLSRHVLTLAPEAILEEARKEPRP